MNEAMAFNVVKTYGTVESWIGFLGSYIGGFIGGAIGALVAYFVAKLQVAQIQKQIDENKRSEQERWFLRQYPSVVKLQFEIDKIIKSYVFIDGWKKIKDPIPANIQVDALPLAQLKVEYWQGIDALLDMELQTELLKIREQYEFVYDVITKELQHTLEEAEKVKTQLENLNGSKKREELIQSLQKRNFQLQSEIFLTGKQKESVYEDSEEKLANAKLLQGKLNGLASKLKERITEFGGMY